MCTLSCKGPAIKQRIHYWNILLAYILKEHREIQEIAMQIVNLYHIWLNRINPLNELASTAGCTEAFFTKDTGIPKSMYLVL